MPVTTLTTERTLICGCPGLNNANTQIETISEYGATRSSPIYEGTVCSKCNEEIVVL